MVGNYNMTNFPAWDIGCKKFINKMNTPSLEKHPLNKIFPTLSLNQIKENPCRIRRHTALKH